MRHIPILILLILLIAAPAAAGNTVTLVPTITSSNQYISADNLDSAVITVTVKDSQGIPIDKADISLGVLSPWRLKDSVGKTKSDGTFATTFSPTVQSGNATITVTATGMTSSGLLSNSSSYKQVVVGGEPQRTASYYKKATTVGTLTELTVLVTDRYGNPVTSLKKKNEVIFNTSAGSDNGFLGTDGKVKNIAVPLNSSGYAEVDFIASTKAGENYIIITPPSPLPQSLISINGISDAIPARITQVVTPSGNPPTLVLSASSRFIIDYRLYDKYGNPAANQDLAISVNTGEEMVVMSNSEGNVSISYSPPKPNAGLYTINAQSVTNPAVTVSTTLQFVSGVPSNMILTASPQSMASLDAVEDSYSLVMAKVIDNQGNPVPGEAVSFSIQDVDKGGFIQVDAPYLKGDKGGKTSDTKEITSVTDNYGYAMATFIPGRFTKDTENPGFSLMAEGSANVQARWGSVTHDIEMSYKNYPYLSVHSTVDPMTVSTNGTVQLSIRVKGDGYALKPKPIEVILVTDRSGSMLSDKPDRMDSVRTAAQGFVDQLSDSSDAIGLVSFGYDGYISEAGEHSGLTRERDNKYSVPKDYNGYATLDAGLGSPFPAVKDTLGGMVPDGGTPMRYGLKLAIDELKNSPVQKAGSVKAIVLLSDGDYNYYGDPLARGSPRRTCTDVCDAWNSWGWCTHYTKKCTPSSPDVFGNDASLDYIEFDGVSSQNMSQYAVDNKIRIFTIQYKTTDATDTLYKLANTTGGKFYTANSMVELVTFYGQIAGALKDTAGVNTTLSLDFGEVELNGEAVPGKETLQYKFIEGVSTRISRPDGTWETVNTTAGWNEGRINVTMGTIKVNQTWLVNLTLKVLKPGNIKLLGSSSEVFFRDVNDFSDSVPLPDTFITALPEWLEQGLQTPKLTLSNLRVVVSEDRSTASLAWDIEYNGRDPEIIEQIDLSPRNADQWGIVGSTKADGTDRYDTASLDVRLLPDGIYKVRVTGYVFDAGSSSTEADMILMTTSGKPVILIQ